MKHFTSIMTMFFLPIFVFGIKKKSCHFRLEFFLYPIQNIFSLIQIFFRLLIQYQEDIFTQENLELNSFAISLRFGYFFPQIDWTICLLFDIENKRDFFLYDTKVEIMYLLRRNKTCIHPARSNFCINIQTCSQNDSI